MKMRIAAALAVAATAVAAVPALGRQTAAPPPTKTPGTLTVAFGDPAIGFASGQVHGTTISNPKGYEVDLATAIGKKLGNLKLSWVYTPWAGLFKPGGKSFDLSFQEATITAQRSKTVTFSTPYLDANQGVLISKKTTAPKSIADLKSLQTCAQTDTTGLDWINTVLHPAKKPLIYQQTAAAFTAVRISKCDALILDVPIVALERKSHPSNYGPVAGQIVTHEQYGAVMAKGSKLAPSVNAAIKSLTSDGTIAQLQKKWFSFSFKSVPVLK
jgi:polar amino acid transport system substrate-binding protein